MTTKKIILVRSPAMLSISRPRGNNGEIIWIIVRTSDDRNVAAYIDIPLAEFAAALVGQGEVPCAIELLE